MRRSLLVIALAAPVLLAGCSEATEALSAVQDAGKAISSVQDVCSQAEAALASGESNAQIAEGFRQPLEELRTLLAGATVIPGLQGVVDSLDQATAALDAGTANTAALGKQLAQACAAVGQ